MSEIENGRLGLYGIEHSKCNHLMTLGFKGLNFRCVGICRQRVPSQTKTDHRYRIRIQTVSKRTMLHLIDVRNATLEQCLCYSKDNYYIKTRGVSRKTQSS